MMKFFSKLLNTAPIKRHISKDKSGIAAIEFALVVPILLVMLFASVDAVFALTAKRKVSTAANSIADISARELVQLTDPDIDGIELIGRLIMSPFDAQNASIRISGATVDASGQTATVNWTETRGPGFSTSLGGQINLPANLDPATFIIVAQTELPYQTLFGNLNLPFLPFSPSFTLSETSYFRSRSGDIIAGPP